MVLITLRRIKHTWNNYMLRQLNDSEFLKAILPDIYNKELTSNIYLGSQHELSLLSEERIKKFLSGNRRSEKNGKYYAVANLTKDIKKWLLSEEKIVYKEKVKEHIEQTAKESMLSNISKYVKNTQPKISKNHSLFKDIPLNKDSLYDTYLVETIEKLLNINSEKSLTYVIFLLLLVSIFQDNIIEFKEFYLQETINKEISYINHEQNYDINLTFNNESYTYFTDPNYMNEYNFYMYKPHYTNLYYLGKFKIECDKQNIPKATLILKDEASTQIYTGIPMLSKNDEMVYIILTNPKGLLSILCFRYDHFNYFEMYYRTALFIISYQRYRIPQVQKAVISKKRITNNDMPIIKGILKMTTDKITITENQMNDFLETFAEAEWMNDFKKDFLPFIESHKCQCYSFSENEIISYTLSNMDELDRLKAIYSMKSKLDYPNSIDCKDPEKLHRLMKIDEK